MRGAGATLSTLLLAAWAGCASALWGGGLDAWQAEKPPRLRIAASPYPNHLLHILPTNEGLGEHLYRPRISTLGFEPSSETGRGHFYTRRGGFLDLAHIRRTIDFAGYLHYRVSESLRAGESHFSFESIDRTSYHCHIRYPKFWSGLPPGERESMIEEIALRAAAEGAFDFNNWREVLTWYDFHNVPGLRERGSAFSYEDVPSHGLGVQVALDALQAEGLGFDEAVTRELAASLDRLGRVSEEDYRRAMDLVSGRWWGKKTCLKRHLDLGLDDGFVDPWLVPGLFPEDPKAARFPAPRSRWGEVRGYDCRGMVVLECEPRPRRDEILRRILPPGATRVRPSRDFPALIARIEKEARRELGPDATRP